jgi:phosphatidylserine/phosphatidylglycerophosphate/cardiolipin synthase-like enzyme
LLPLLLALTILFSPHGGCTDAIIRELHKAKTSIYVQAYSFTSYPIAAELIEARHLRHLDVRVILDKSWPNESPKMGALLATSDIQVLVDAQHAIAHNKVIVIDNRVAITGSFNFTWQAEHQNAENLLIIRSEATAATFKWNWLQHAAHSLPLVLPTTDPSPSPSPSPSSTP